MADFSTALSLSSTCRTNCRRPSKTFRGTAAGGIDASTKTGNAFDSARDTHVQGEHCCNKRDEGKMHQIHDTQHVACSYPLALSFLLGLAGKVMVQTMRPCHPY
jgi:hypothetical protein